LAGSTIVFSVYRPFLKSLILRRVSLEASEFAVAMQAFLGYMTRGIRWGPSVNIVIPELLSLVSMSGICFIIAIITARSRQELLSVGANYRCNYSQLHRLYTRISAGQGRKAGRKDMSHCRL